MKKLMTGFAAASLALAASQASASGIDWSLSPYAGAGMQFSRFNEWSIADRYNDGSFTSRSKTSDASGYRLFGGVNFLKHFAIEAGYSDSGEATSVAQSDGSGSLWAAGTISESVSSSGLDLSLTGKLPVTANFTLYGKGGSNYRSTHSEFSGTTQCCGGYIQRDNRDKYGLLYGAGAEYSGFRQVRLAAGYAHVQADYGMAGKGTLESISVTAAYLF